MTCNFCVFSLTRERLAKEKRKVFLKAGDGWIYVWSYRTDPAGRSKDMRYEGSSFKALTLQCSCDEDS